MDPPLASIVIEQGYCLSGQNTVRESNTVAKSGKQSNEYTDRIYQLDHAIPLLCVRRDDIYFTGCPRWRLRLPRSNEVYFCVNPPRLCFQVQILPAVHLRGRKDRLRRQVRIYIPNTLQRSTITYDGNIVRGWRNRWDIWSRLIPEDLDRNCQGTCQYVRQCKLRHDSKVQNMRTYHWDYVY